MTNNTVSEYKRRSYSAVDVISKVSLVLIYAVMVITALSLIVPIAWMIINSFKGHIEYYNSDIFELPKKLGLENYVYTLSRLEVVLQTSRGRITYNLLSMFINSIIWSTVNPFFYLLMCMICAYVISRYKFFGRDFLYSFGLLLMVLPIFGSLPSAMSIRKALGIYDNMFLMIFTGPSSAFYGMNFLIFYAAFKGIPWEYAEAVFIDGGGHFKTFISIMIPMILPTFGVLFVLGFIGNWNDYETFLIWLPSYANIAYGIYYFQYYAQSTGATTPHILAGFTVVAIPSVLMYAASHKLVMAKFTVGGLKG